MKVHGHPMSGCTRKVLATMFECGLVPTLVLVDLRKGEQKQPAHLAVQPFGKVPALVDDFVLFESQAIMRYISARYGKNAGLVPVDVRERARMDQFMSVNPSYFSAGSWLIMKNVMLAPMFGAAVPDEIATARRDLGLGLDVLERALDNRDYLARTFSLADIDFCPVLQMLTDARQDDLIHNRPAVAAWWSRLRDRSAWRSTMAMSAVSASAPRKAA